MSLEQDREQRLNEWFREYRAACPDVEAGAGFMPALWARIEARRNPMREWVTLSRRALVAAMALCLVLGVILGTAITSSPFYQLTYVEALDDASTPEDLAAMHPVAFEAAEQK